MFCCFFYCLVKPKVEGKPADVTCLLDETAKLNVKFSAIPKPTVTWHKADGTEVKPNDRIQIITDENGQSTLIINHAKGEDSQPYTARATNKVGSVDAKVNLTVKGNVKYKKQKKRKYTCNYIFVEVKPSLKNDLEPQTINVGDELLYRLVVDGRPAPTVKFYKDGNEVGPVTIEQPSKPDDTTVTAVFRIPKASMDNQGEYQASVENPAGVVKTKKVKVTVQQTPVFLKAPQDASVSQGKDVTYEAELSGFPTPKVTWLLNGKPLTPNADCTINFDTKTQKATLTIRKVDADKHKGAITCQVENPAGKITHDVKLDVRTQPKISKPLKDESIVEGQDVTLTIEAVGNPAPKPEWYLNDKPIPANDQHFQVITPKEGNVYELKIKQAKPTDEGTYKVVMKNSEGEIVSQAKLDVHTVPVIGSVPAKIEALQGQQVVIPVKVSGRPKPEVTFLKDKKDVTTLEDKSRFRIEHDDKTNEVRLIISDVREDDQGKYTIRAKNPAQIVEETTNLVVKAPLAFIDKLQDTDVISGQNLVLTCRCQGIPKPTVKWFQNDNEIKSTTKQKIESKPDGTETLTINRVDLTDSGDFKVVITNPDGTIASTCHVDVLTKPKIDGKPQDVQVTLGEPAELTVKLSGLPKPNVQWLKNGQPFNIDNKRVKVIQKDDSCSLLIENTQLDDKAVYTLKATNKAGEVESPKLTLNVSAIAPKLKSDLVKDIVAQTGERVPLTIKASGTKPKVTWFKDGEEVVTTVEEGYEIVEEEETYTLLIKNAKPTNSGEYQAVVTNDVGQVKSKKIKVQVQKAPELKKKPQALVKVKEGQPAQFDCEFDGNPSPKVTWLRDGKPLTPRDGFDIQTDVITGRSVLKINQTTSKHSGPITLRLENSVGNPIEETVQLEVETAPQLLQKPPATTEAFINQTCIIPFKCASSPKPTIKLFKNEIQVPLNGDHYELVPNPNDSTSFEIRIKNVRPDDDGNYRLLIENPLGKIDSNIQVTTVENVSIKPTKPNKTDLKQHDTLTLEFQVDGKPKPEIAFMKDGKEVKPSPKTQITYDEKTKICRLVTTDVGQEDQGVYTLIAKNRLGKQETEPVKVTVTAPITVKTKLPETTDGIAGEQVVLTVEADGLPQPKVTWLCNGQPLKTSPKYRIETPKDKPNQINLIITKLDTNDTGKYTAVIDNGLEKVETNTKLTVHTKPKLESKLEPNLSFNIGEQAVIPIQLSGDDNTVTWYKDNQPIQFDKRIRVVTDETNSYRLIIDDLRPEDKGNYTIVVKNKGGSIEIKTTIIVKEQKPQLLADLNDSPAANTAKIGEKFFLEIRAQGKPRPQVTWLLNGQELPKNSPDYEFIVTEDGVYRIVFHRFDEKYLGEYQAIITSTAGSIRTRKIIVIGQQAPIFTQAPPKFIQIKTGEKLTIELTAKGHPPPKITWLRDGKVLSNKDGFEIRTDQTGHSFFVIPRATVQHKGKYECRLENQYGTHTAEINIDVLRKFQYACRSNFE